MEPVDVLTLVKERQATSPLVRGRHTASPLAKENLTTSPLVQEMQTAMSSISIAGTGSYQNQ
jgi:hypothetical protein